MKHAKNEMRLTSNKYMNNEDNNIHDMRPTSNKYMNNEDK